MNKSYVSGLLTGLGSGSAGIWFAIGYTAGALMAAAVALVGIVVGVVGIASEAKKARHAG